MKITAKTKSLSSLLIILASIIFFFPLKDITHGQEEPCSMLPDLECTRKSFLPDIGTQESTSTRGCTSTNYTGQEVNNPLHVSVKGILDENLLGTIVWLSESNNTPNEVEIVNEYTSTNPSEIGVMILKNGSWENTPLTYISTSENDFALIQEDDTIVLDDVNTTITISIDNPQIIEGEIIFDFLLSFNPLSDTQLQKTYNFKSTHLYEEDIHREIVNTSLLERFFSWNIDLKSPLVEKPEQMVLGPQVLDLELETTDDGSEISDIIIKGYKLGDLNNGSLTLENPSGFPTLATETLVPPSDQIGHMTGEYSSNSWHFQNIDNPTYNNTFRINIGLSEGGGIVLYSTVFDHACNYTSKEHRIDLTPWIVTKGGIVHTEGSFNTSAKNVSLVSGLENSIRNILKTELTSATEIISSRSNAISTILYADTLRIVRAMNSSDSNNKKGFWFEYFKKKLEYQKTNLEEFTLTGTESKVSDACTSENCFFYSTNPVSIPENFICDKNTLIMSESDIFLNPDITEPENTNSTKGCIFISKENIIIQDGSRKSTAGTVEYDYIEGFMIAEKQINIQVADTQELVRDALEVKGALIALGDKAQGIQLSRNLRLFNYSHPTLVVSWDIKYARLSEVFFGIDAPLYKQEVGFKSF